MQNVLKVLLVCHFSNSKVRDHLQLDNRRLYTFVRRLLGMPNKGDGYGDIAAWDTYMIEHLRKRDDIDLYVISAHSGLKRGVVSFELEGVHYYFVRCDRATLLKRLIKSPSLWHKLNPMRPVVRKIVNQVKPDVVALVGAENAYISGTVLGIGDYPLIVKCQTIYNNPERGKQGVVDRKNAYVEREIFKNLKYVAVNTNMHHRLFRQMNQTAINFKWTLGNLLPEVKMVEKRFDFVNYAMEMIDKKGFNDAIKALTIVKNRYPNVHLNLVGGATQEEKQALTDLVSQCGLSENVTFTQFFERQEDMFQHIQQARFALLPCKMDYISSTIRQAMHYGLPVVCYRTEGTVTLNQEKECVLIAENGNVDDLAKNMLLLMDDGSKAEELQKNAKEYSKIWDEDERITQQMVHNFRAVVEHYRNGTPVPEALQYKEL